MKCPKCGYWKIGIMKTVTKTYYLRRRYRCVKCNYRETLYDYFDINMVGKRVRNNIKRQDGVD